MLFLKFEDLKADLKNQVKIIAEFLGFTLSEEEAEQIAEESSFQSMKAKPEKGLDLYGELFFKKGNSHLRKGVIGDWKNYFTDRQLAALEKLYESRLGATDIGFELTTVSET